MRKQWSCLEKEMQGTMYAGEEDQAVTRQWTTSRHGQDSPWKSQSEWQRTEINGESTSMVWPPTLELRTATEQNRKSGPMLHRCLHESDSDSDSWPGCFYNIGSGSSSARYNIALFGRPLHALIDDWTSDTASKYAAPQPAMLCYLH